MKKGVLVIFKEKVLEVLKNREVKFIIFGSRGRGDAEEFSDYDLLIITPEKEYGVKEKIEEIEIELFINRNAIINSHLFSEAELKKLSFEPFIMNALREGIAA
ncbi:MAG: nucleotidyltransferase domain-containing protein [Candidatus Aminicenantes bacterium]|nr:nucleotidyltransferase domain-containing protein [Candidatus Aminicenantes bacterium]